MKKIGRALLCGGLFGLAAFAQDPPSRVARLNYIQGNVSMEPASFGEWVPAAVNRPFTIGDDLYTDVQSQAELHMDVAVLRMAPQTNFSFLNLDDQTVQIKLTAGNMYFHIRNFGPNQVFEVDTPNAAFTLLREGIYRVDVDPNGNTSFAVVRQGQAEVTGGGQAFTLSPGNSASLSGTDSLSYDVEVAPNPDQFDNWCSQRDYREAHLQSARYVSPSMIGYEDLDSYGDWQTVPTYGAIWYPRRVDNGWAPYHNGHWAWIQPWGWTWVDDAPWGFAPFHYGRWAYVSGRWGWCPGPPPARVSAGYVGPVVRPQYAPALVAFFGGAHWGVSVTVGGGGPSLGWVPLGYGEVYSPPYRVSPRYFRNVNESNTVINKNVNITNVYNTTYVVNKTTNVTVVNNNQRYVNMSAPGAVTAMPQAAFAGGRPVARNAVAATPAQVAQIQPASASMLTPAVAPTRQALAPAAGTVQAARPPQQFMARQVVAKQAPPPAPASFAAQQSYFQQHAGQPFDAAAMHQAAPARPVNAVVRQAPPAAAVPVPVRAGQKFGNQAAFGRPGAPAPVAPQRAAPSAPAVPAARAEPPAHPVLHPPQPAERTQIPPPPPNHTEGRPAVVRPAPGPKPATPAIHPPPPPHQAPRPEDRKREEDRKKEEERRKQPQ